MILPLLLAGAALFPGPQSQTPPKPISVDAEQVKSALVQLKEAFAKTDAGPRIRAIEAAANLADAEVVRYLGRGLDDKDVSVQKAAIEALRFNAHEKALDELLARAKVKAAKDDLPLYATLLRAVGQHGSPRSIELLTENPWSAPDAQVIQAKILGLGKVRTKEALKALTDLMEIAGPQKIQPFMKDFRLALWSLSGADQGESRDLWLVWYRENKSNLKIAPEPAAEPKELSRRWQQYWAKPSAEGEAGKERRRGGERGDGGKQ
ncbi:MAG: HEAT repeat domain-containing protein [Planctomycetota bacterium]|nr:HEAT repeat domain-containing protein [Planctomycetota bacterium]